MKSLVCREAVAMIRGGRSLRMHASSFDKLPTLLKLPASPSSFAEASEDKRLRRDESPDKLRTNG